MVANSIMQCKFYGTNRKSKVSGEDNVRSKNVLRLHGTLDKNALMC